MMKKLLVLLLCLTLVVISFGALYMDRDSDTNGSYVQLGDKTDYSWMHGSENSLGFKWTISCWIRVDAWPASDYATVFASEAGATTQKGVVGMFSTTGTFFRSIDRGQSGTGILPGGFATLDVPLNGEWHHFAWTYDSTPANGNSKIYIDGVLKDTGNKLGNGIAGDSSRYPCISAITDDLATVTAGFDGAFDDYRIYKQYVFTQEDVLEVYGGRGNDGLVNHPRLYTRLMFQDKAEGVSVTNIIDSSSNGNDAVGATPSSADLPKSVGSELKFKKARN